MNILSRLSISMLTLLWSLMIQGQASELAPNHLIVNLSSHSLKFPYYSSHNSQTPDPANHLVIVIHGNRRNADDYFQNMQTAASLRPSSSSKTTIVAPQFLIESDLTLHGLDDSYLYWTSGGWKSGSNSRDEETNPRPARIPSFAVVDSLILHLVNNSPNLQSITLTGHSAGGQFVNRYSATTPMVNELCSGFGIPVKFIVANPSSYVYLNNRRAIPGSTIQFQIPIIDCSDYNDWKYGLDNLYTYPEMVGRGTILSNFKSREVVYLLGENDNDPNSSSLDTSCEAMLQGDHRYERGITYQNHLMDFYGEDINQTHSIVSVPNVGHNNLDMYISNEGLEQLFDLKPMACSEVLRTGKRSLDPVFYPNPTKMELFWSDLDIANLSIWSITGQEIINAYEPDGERSIMVNHLQKGTYILGYELNGIRRNHKFIKE